MCLTRVLMRVLLHARAPAIVSVRARHGHGHTRLRPRSFVQLPGIVTSPSSAEEHASNFSIVLEAIKADEHVASVAETKGLSAQALAEGDLQSLHDFAGIFEVLCDALLSQDNRGGSSSAMAVAAGRASPPLLPSTASAGAAYSRPLRLRARATRDPPPSPLPPPAASLPLTPWCSVSVVGTRPQASRPHGPRPRCRSRTRSTAMRRARPRPRAAPYRRRACSMGKHQNRRERWMRTRRRWKRAPLFPPHRPWLASCRRRRRRRPWWPAVPRVDGAPTAEPTPRAPPRASMRWRRRRRRRRARAQQRVSARRAAAGADAW